MESLKPHQTSHSNVSVIQINTPSHTTYIQIGIDYMSSKTISLINVSRCVADVGVIVGSVEENANSPA